MSGKRAQANQRNSRRSTGPRTRAGKRIVSQNGLKHGVLSAKLILEGEDPEEFRALLAELDTSLAPLGVLEQALVEKVAIALWRQRRLICAETATLELQRRSDTPEFKATIGSVIGHRGSISNDALLPPEIDKTLFYRLIVGELDQLRNPTSLNHLKRIAPNVWSMAILEAENKGMELDELLATYYDTKDQLGSALSNLTSYLQKLRVWIESQLRPQEDREKVQEVLAFIQESRTVALRADLLARYETALDGQLYRALRALREVQATRVRSIEGHVEVVGRGAEREENSPIPSLALLGKTEVTADSADKVQDSRCA